MTPFSVDLAKYVKLYGADTMELEWRLGTTTGAGGPFKPGTSRESFDKIMGLMQSSTISGTRVDTETVERISKDRVRYSMPSGTYIKKTPVMNALISPGIRVSAATELAVSPETFHDAAAFTRRKSRTSYTYKCFRYDLTRVTSNHPDDLDSEDQTYEIEVELVDKSYVFKYELAYLLDFGTHLITDLQVRSNSAV